MAALGATTMLVCSNVADDAVDDDDLAAEQLHAARRARAADRGLRIAYEALAWGRHVSTYDHSWRIVAARRSPRPRRLPGQLPHPLARRPTSRRSPRSRARRSSSCSWPTPRGCGWTSCSGAGTTAASPARAPSTSPRFLAAVLAAGLPRAALAGGLQRRLPPGGPRSHGDRRDALPAAARGGHPARSGRAPARSPALDVAERCPPRPPCAATRSPSWRSTRRSWPRPRGCWPHSASPPRAAIASSR